MEQQISLGDWLKRMCEREHLTLREAASKTGLSHATIASIIKGNHPLPETLRKLAQSFGDGDNQRLALEDKLLILAGYRTEQPGEQELSEPLARLLDKVKHFSESQIRIMGHFADYISEIGRGSDGY